MARSRIPWQRDGYPGALPELEVRADRAALVVVDLQYSCADPETPRHLALRAEVPELYEAWARRIRELVLPHTRRLLDWFRDHGRPVIYTRVGSLLPDAADQHRKRREVWGRGRRDPQPPRSYPGCPDFEVMAEVAPRPGELVIDKNTSSACIGSPLAFHCFQLGLETLVVCGVSTFACVDGTARDAADMGYNVVVVDDACAAAPGGEAAHEATLATLGRLLGSVRTTDEVLADLDALNAAVRPEAPPAPAAR